MHRHNTCGIPLPGSVPKWFSNASDVGVAETFACAVTATGPAGTNEVVCCGGNQHGQLGKGVFLGESTQPKSVVPVSAPQQLVVGVDHACALDASEKVWCWGWNAFGQLGNGNIGTDANTPQLVTFPP